MKNCYNCKYRKPILDGFRCIHNEVEQIFHKPIYECKFFEKGNFEEINFKIRPEVEKILNYKPVMTNRQKQIEELAKQEKEDYEKRKKEFYDNPIHWDNNKRRRNGLPVIRGTANKTRVKKYHSFRPTVKIFSLIEDIIEETLSDNIRNGNFIDNFVDVKNDER